MGAVAKRVLGGRNSRRRPAPGLLEAEIPEAGGRSGGPVEEAQESARGVIRLERVYLLTRYGTVYGLFDEQTAAYDCALKSRVYRLDDYAGDFVEVTGALADVGGELPVINVTRLRLLRTKWMR